MERLRRQVLEVRDLGDLPVVTYCADPVRPREQNLALVAGVASLVADRVAHAVRGGALPLVLGGDCSITIGVVAGLLREAGSVGLVYFDGGLDLNTPEVTPSGIFDGMGLAHILGEGAEQLSRLGPRYPLLQEERVLVFGYDEGPHMDTAEIVRLGRSRMIKYPLERIRMSPIQTAGEALAELESRASRILVHFDVDVMNFTEFPGAEVPNPNGLDFKSTRRVLDVFTASSQFAGLVITEFNAERDLTGELAERLVSLVTDTVGRRRSAKGSSG